jgi:YfiH family protein
MRLGPAEVRFTGRAEGDLVAPVAGEAPSPSVEARRRALVDRPWTWLRQAHGGRVVVVEHPGHRCGEAGDAAVTAAPGAALAVFTADCAPVALASPEGVIGVVHAGWRGLEAGVLERAADAMRALGASRIEAALGPCIHPECYPFGPGDLDRLAERLGDDVRATTASGAVALDLPAAVRCAGARAGVELVHDEAVCTSCAGDRYFSHRARGEPERQAMVLWRP